MEPRCRGAVLSIFSCRSASVSKILPTYFALVLAGTIDCNPFGHIILETKKFLRSPVTDKRRVYAVGSSRCLLSAKKGMEYQGGRMGAMAVPGGPGKPDIAGPSFPIGRGAAILPGRFSDPFRNPICGADP